MVLFYITWAPWKSWMLPENMGQLTSSMSQHRGDLLSQSHKSCGDVHPPPGFTSPLPPGTMGLSCQGARVRGHGIPPSCQIWGQIPRPLLHWAKSRSSLAPCNPSGESQQEEPQRDFFFKNLPFTAWFFFSSSFFFLFFFFSTTKETGLYGKLTALVYGSHVWEPVSVCARGHCWILQRLLLSLEPKLPRSLRYLLIM